MDEQMQQQIVALVQAAMEGNQEAQAQIQQIMQAAQQGDQEAVQIAQMIQAVAQQMQGQSVPMNRLGAKINYIKYLRGNCPEGYEMKMFKRGGQVCKECVKKQTAVKKQEGGEMDAVSAFKCGRKMKKKEQGGNVEKYSGGNALPTAEPASERYKGGTYVGPSGLPQKEYITGPDQLYNSPAKMTLEHNPFLGDSIITEVPPHFKNVSGAWWLPSSVKVKPRTARNNGGNSQEWQILKKRWEQAKKVTK